MKKIFSAIFGLVFVSSVFATGVTQQNPAQNGVISFTGTGQSYTNTFAYPFTAAPFVQLFAFSTNATPMTNTITSSNFVLSVASTNVSVGWTATIGNTRLQNGTYTATASGSTNLPFLAAFLANPNLTYGYIATGTNSAPLVTALTTTNLTVLFATTNTIFYWQAVGTTFNPGNTLPGAADGFPLFNPVTY